MSRFVSFSAWAIVLCGLLESAASAQSPREQIELKDQSCYSGLIESEDADWLTLIRIQTPRGRQTHLVIQPFAQSQIEKVTRLDAEQRAALQKQIEEFRNRATIEAVRMEAIQLKPSQGEGRAYRHYQSKWFALDSTANEASTRRVIVRAEQIFAAYRQIVPPRTEPARPLRLIVLGSMDEYQAVLAKLGVKAKIANSACFLEDQNTVVIGSDLTRLAAVSSQFVAQNAQLRRDLSDLEGRLPERLRAVAESLKKSGLSNAEVSVEVMKERLRFKKQIDKKRDELRQSDLQIDRTFKQSAGQMLVRLYHEAFHAYVRNWVFPRPQYDIPHWLDEGLAVLFEGGLLEGNTLRVDAPNSAALAKLKADMAGPEPLELKKLLAADEGRFLIMSATRPAAVDRYYVNAWGMAYYLTFEKRLLNSPVLEQYLRRANAQLAPAARFQQLIGMPRAEFEQQWREYIRGL